MRNFKNDVEVEKAAQSLFDQAYGQQWPEYVVVRFSDPELQHRGVDVALFKHVPDDPIAAIKVQLDGGKRVAILIDEKATESGGEVPGLPVEVEHWWWGWQRRPGWIADPKHRCEVIAYGCLSTKAVHLFRADDVKTNWEGAINRGRRSRKENQGMLNPGDWWLSVAYYTDGYDCFKSHRCISMV